MVADVSYWVRIMKQQQQQQQPKSSPLITRDLLPDLHSSKELDLDLHVPHGFHKRLDLKSGKVYLERCKPSEQSTTTTTTNQRLQDLNFPPPSRKPLNLFDDTNLDLKLHPHSYQSVCTLDKVKFALQRAQKEPIKKRSSMSPSSNSSSISVVKEKETDNDNDNDDDDDKSYAAGCPSCLLYVLISTSNPRCPRCNITVPSPSTSPIKKPRIDLNLPI